jgi:Tfp pilus assembly protein PilE
MNLIRRQLNAVRRTAQKGFTLIELAIVGLFLGLLAIFAISQFSGSATDATKANGIFEASTKIADNWALIAQSCGITNDITGWDLTTNASGTAATVAKNNLDVLLGVTAASTNLTTCINSSGVRPLTGVATGSAGAETIQGYAVTASNDTALFAGRNTLKLTYGSAAKYVPDTLILPLYNKYSSVSGASTASTVPAAADATDKAIQFAASTARTLTIVKNL